MNLSDTLKRWRKEAGTNQRAAADSLEIDFTYISKIENGRLEPSVSLIEKMARLYGRTEYESDIACISKGDLPSWVKPLILEYPGLLSILRKQAPPHPTFAG